MVRMTDVYDNKYYNVTVGLWKEIFDNHCPNRRKVTNPFQCRHPDFSIASDYLKCIGIKTFIPVFHDKPGFSDDVWPFPAAVYDSMISNYFTTTPVQLGQYSFAMATSTFNNLDLLSTSYLLLSPFRSTIWAASIVLLLACLAGLLLSEKIFREFIKHDGNKVLSVNLWDFIFMTSCGIIFSGLYVSNLTAIVNVKNRYHVPFKSIEELTTMVKNGEKTLVSESLKVTYIWSVIKGESLIDGQYPEQFQNLYRATWSNPPLEISNLNVLCYKLAINSSLVYVGRITTLEEHCSHYCFWKLDMPIIPYMYMAYYAKKHWILRQEANLCVDFMRSSSQVDLNRNKEWPAETCQKSVQSDLIKFPSMVSVIWLFIIGNLLATATLVMEIRYKKKLLMKRHYTKLKLTRK